MRENTQEAIGPKEKTFPVYVVATKNPHGTGFDWFYEQQKAETFLQGLKLTDHAVASSGPHKHVMFLMETRFEDPEEVQDDISDYVKQHEDWIFGLPVIVSEEKSAPEKFMHLEYGSIVVAVGVIALLLILYLTTRGGTVVGG